jgi:hypothetical protein
MTVYLFHGCVDRWYPGQERFRNFIPESALRNHLADRPVKYGRWIGGNETQDVLTVDDSTRGAGRLCKVARQMGHEVTLFVNPQQIISGQPYFFSLLDAYLDARRVSTICYRGNRYDLGIYPQLQAFRKAAKAVLCALSEHKAYIHVSELKDDLHAMNSAIPDHAQLLTLADLIELRDMGVTVENHGWSHVEISSLSAAEFTEHVIRGRDWLVVELSVLSIDYAVPFGLSPVPKDKRHVVPGTVFLANSTLPKTELQRACWNRSDITRSLQHFSR